MGKSSPIFGSREEFDETQLHACCPDLPGEVLTTWRGNFSECNQIKSNYIIHSEGKRKGEDNLWLTFKLLASPGGRQRLSTKKGREKIILGEA